MNTEACVSHSNLAYQTFVLEAGMAEIQDETYLDTCGLEVVKRLRLMRHFNITDSLAFQ